MADKTIDARGSHCPGPMMDLIRAIKQSQVGETLAVLSTDPGSQTDILMWAAKAGQEFVGVTQHEGYQEIAVKKIK